MTRTADAVGMSEANAPIPAVQSGAVAWGCFEGDKLDENLVYRNKAKAEAASQAFGDGVHLTVRPLYLAAPQSEPLPGGVGEAVERLVALIDGNEAYAANVMDENRIWLARILADEILAALSGKEQG